MFSFARYNPDMYGTKSAEDHTAVILRRSMKTMTHELGHMFGMRHCIYYQCLMNGSNHLDEADSRPLFLCPVCLRKLHHAVGFDPVARYEAIEKALAALESDAVSFADDRNWLLRRARFVHGSQK